jgi:hypothetical protein
MKTIINFFILNLLLFAASSQCFADTLIEDVSRERAKELGMEIRLKAAGSDSVTVELAFKTEGELKSFSRVDMQIRDGTKVLLASSLREERTNSGRVAVSFSADHSIVDKITLRVMTTEPELGGSGYDLRVKDFLSAAGTKDSGSKPANPAPANPKAGALKPKQP